MLEGSDAAGHHGVAHLVSWPVNECCSMRVMVKLGPGFKSPGCWPHPDFWALGSGNHHFYHQELGSAAQREFLLLLLLQPSVSLLAAILCWAESPPGLAQQIGCLDKFLIQSYGFTHAELGKSVRETQLFPIREITIQPTAFPDKQHNISVLIHRKSRAKVDFCDQHREEEEEGGRCHPEVCIINFYRSLLMRLPTAQSLNTPKSGQAQKQKAKLDWFSFLLKAKPD
ncbi:hypothetical protein Anapl_01476 [Anas platyrhynchos]|uniref:Uncharacterized protein n=1 Tax=Anas platyrhynchos TaxID=8839 RepID=R0KD18_ANAPL|nr:hypothetical protein Anapl_01476 [Anas platyrhynchos]